VPLRLQESLPLPLLPIVAAMSLFTRAFLPVLLLCATPPAGAAPQAEAAGYPSRPIRLVVPFPPGGGADAVGRLVALRLSQATGASVVVENRGGAGGSIGAAAVAAAPHDGYTLLLGTNATHGINPSLYASPGYDAERDFAPVATIATAASALVVAPAFPARDVAGLIALAKSGTPLTFASAGSGTGQHLGGELFKSLAHVDLLHVPYRGGGPATVDLLGGTVSMMFDSLPSALANIRAGKLRALGVTTTHPVAQLPGVPPISDTVPGYELSAWYGVLAPAGTPAPVVAWLNRAINGALADPQARAQLVDAGLDPEPGPPQALAGRIHAEIPRWRQIIETSHARAE